MLKDLTLTWIQFSISAWLKSDFFSTNLVIVKSLALIIGSVFIVFLALYLGVRESQARRRQSGRVRAPARSSLDLQLPLDAELSRLQGRRRRARKVSFCLRMVINGLQ